MRPLNPRHVHIILSVNVGTCPIRSAVYIDSGTVGRGGGPGGWCSVQTNPHYFLGLDNYSFGIRGSTTTGIQFVYSNPRH